MAGPISGIGSQQIPLSQPYQPGGSDQTREVRQDSQDAKENTIQSRNAQSAQTQEANSNDNQQDTSSRNDEKSNLNTITANAQNTEQRRGSVVNLVV